MLIGSYRIVCFFIVLILQKGKKMAANAIPDAKLNDFFAKKKKKKSNTAPTTITQSPVLKPTPNAGIPSSPVKATGATPEKKPATIVQAKGKTLADLNAIQNVAIVDEEEDEETELEKKAKTHWTMKPKKKVEKIVAPGERRRLQIDSERAFPSLNGDTRSGGRAVKTSQGVKTQNVWSSIAADEDSD